MRMVVLDAMAMNVLPIRVPWPEVGEHTDSINFENVGFPATFDPERLSVSLARLDLARRVIGLGGVQLTGGHDGTRPDTGTITSIHGSGVATAGGLNRSRGESLQSVELKYPPSRLPQHNPGFEFLSDQWGRPDAIIRVNKDEMEARVKAKEYENHLLNPKAQAKYLNKALADGLMLANARLNVGMAARWKLSAIFYGWGLANCVGMGYLLDDTVVAKGMASSNVAGIGVTNLLTVMSALKQNGSGHEVLKGWKELRQSVMVGVSADRFLMGVGAISMGNLIHARRRSSRAYSYPSE